MCYVTMIRMRFMITPILFNGGFGRINLEIATSRNQNIINTQQNSIKLLNCYIPHFIGNIIFWSVFKTSNSLTLIKRHVYSYYLILIFALIGFNSFNLWIVEDAMLIVYSLDYFLSCLQGNTFTETPFSSILPYEINCFTWYSVARVTSGCTRFLLPGD